MEWLFLGLRYAFISIPFVFAALFALIGFWMLVATASRVTTGAWVMGGAFLLETAFVSAPLIPMGLQITTNDLAVALLAAGLIMRVLFFDPPRRKAVYGIWIAIGAIFFISFGLGLISFGTSAGVEARPNFYFWMAGLYFASFAYPPETLEKLWRIAQWCAWLVVAVVIYRWVGLKFGFVSEQLVEYAGASSEFRVVGSNPTFFIAALGVAYFALWLRYSRRRAFLAALVMLGLALVLQHRSVWVAGLGALILVAWHQRTAVAQKAFPIIAVGVAMAGMVATFVLLDPSNRLTATLAKSAVSLTESQGTHTDRLEGWKILLKGYVDYSPREWVLGKPYGTGYDRTFDGRHKGYSPHNFYIQLLLRIGALGLLLFLWAHFSLRNRVREHASGLADTTVSSVLLALLAANLLYYIPYQGFYLQGAFYGVLIGYLATRMPESAAGLMAPGALRVGAVK